jgi:hypothetical protein
MEALMPTLMYRNRRGQRATTNRAVVQTEFGAISRAFWVRGRPPEDMSVVRASFFIEI